MKTIIVLSIATLFFNNAFAQGELIKPAELISPLNNEAHRGIVNQLLWHPAENAAAYRVEVSLTPDFSTVYYQSDVLFDTTFHISTMSFSTIYYWKVYSFSAAATGVFSDVWQFRTTDRIGVHEKGKENITGILNYPNPFFSETTIKYSLTQPCVASISIFDFLGHQKVTLFSSFQNTGSYSFLYEPSSLPSGIYILKFDTEGNVTYHSIEVQK